ncbi:peptidoglycan-binding protein [Streptomyces sp. NPDC059917]|uniref:peptidoglycan-binding domain-containing protein n=1 Tax=Streptomyces sp. NPDC059917 TaxID=3347002 RepID=UPI00364E166F
MNGTLKRLAAKAGVVTATAALLTGVGLGTANASPNAAYIGDGYANNAHAVWCVQHLYNVFAKEQRDRYHYATPDIAEDAAWGPRTKAAVTLLQSWYSETQDGIVGPNTGWDLLHLDSGYGGKGGYCYQYIPSPSWY